jgi:hypothetical protein
LQNELPCTSFFVVDLSFFLMLDVCFLLPVKYPVPLSSPLSPFFKQAALDQAMAARLADLEQKEVKLSAALQEAESRLASRDQAQSQMNQAIAAVASPPAGAGLVSGNNAPDTTDYFDSCNPTVVQGGGTLRTWSFANPLVNYVQVLLKTEGRPLDADIQLWQGPDNTPHKLKVYLEDGGMRTFHTLIGTPDSPNTIAIRNTGMLEFPLAAVVNVDRPGYSEPSGGGGHVAALQVESSGTAELIQGGALRTYPFDVHVSSVAVLLKTDGRPLNARIELLQGPNNNKQVIEVYTEDGMLRPFFALFDTPGSGNVVRVLNTAPVEFPMAATVSPYRFGDGSDMDDADLWASEGIQMSYY